MKNIKITTKEVDQRLDVYLASKLDLSRSQVQKMTKNKQVTVNDKQQTAHYKTQDGDKIKVIETKKPILDLSLRSATFKMTKKHIIAETDDYLIINKPSGIIVHGGEGITELTLADALIKKYPKIKKVGEDTLLARNATSSVAQTLRARRPGIVHRLDKEASGLMVVAKTQDMFSHLKKQFQERETLKKYYALVYGKIENKTDEINFPISRSAKGYKMAARAKNQDGRSAVTSFEIKQEFINYTLLNVTIKTGRTHQIRVHMSAYNHPIVGDDLYGTKKTREQTKKLELGRIFLHAYTLGFKDLDNEWQEFKIEIPSELKKLLKIVK